MLISDWTKRKTRSNCPRKVREFENSDSDLTNFLAISDRFWKKKPLTRGGGGGGGGAWCQKSNLSHLPFQTIFGMKFVWPKYFYHKNDFTNFLVISGHFWKKRFLAKNFLSSPSSFGMMTGMTGVTGVTGKSRVTGARKRRRRRRRRRRCHHGGTNERTNKQGKIGLLSRLTIEAASSRLTTEAASSNEYLKHVTRNNENEI